MARDISKHILDIDIKDDMELISHKFSRVEKRESDLLYKNGDEIVHIEIQNTKRYLLYISDIILIEKLRSDFWIFLQILTDRCIS